MSSKNGIIIDSPFLKHKTMAAFNSHILPRRRGLHVEYVIAILPEMELHCIDLMLKSCAVQLQK